LEAQYVRPGCDKQGCGTVVQLILLCGDKGPE